MSGEQRMHLCDVRLFFAPNSGGVKRYMLAKHHHFAAHVGVRHSLVVCGARAEQIEPEIFTVKIWHMPFSSGYRMPLRLAHWRRELAVRDPDVIEVGDP